MMEILVRIAPWVRDVVLAYAGGLVLGAPVAVLAAYVTGVEQFTTWCLLASMALVLSTLRHQRTRQPRADVAPARAVDAVPVATPDAGARHAA